MHLKFFGLALVRKAFDGSKMVIAQPNLCLDTVTLDTAKIRV